VAAKEFAAGTTEEPGIFEYLASILFCAIIATGYSKHSVRCLVSGKTNEAAAVNELVPTRLSLSLAHLVVLVKP
jgi:hypothetical protein